MRNNTHKNEENNEKNNIYKTSLEIALKKLLK